MQSIEVSAGTTRLIKCKGSKDKPHRVERDALWPTTDCCVDLFTTTQREQVTEGGAKKPDQYKERLLADAFMRFEAVN